MKFHLIDHLEMDPSQPELIEHLLDMKINYLSRKIFGDEERGLDTSRDEERRRNLRAIRATLRADLEAIDAPIEVTCSVVIEPKKA